MKAIVQDKYGSVDLLKLQEVAKPIPKDGEVLVRVRATSVHADVWHVVAGVPYALRLMGSGLRRPKHQIPGTDMAGVVESVGKGATRFEPGDEVFGECLNGHQWVHGGTYAEYVCASEQALALKPGNVSFEQAAAVPSATVIALQGLRAEGRIQAGQRVLINGGGGGVGRLSIQIAKAFGAEVTGVDNSEKLDLMRQLGADQVVDYTVEDFTKSGQLYDLIVDVASTLSLSEARRALTPKGRYVLIGHDHFGTLGRRWLGSIPRMLKLGLLKLFVSHLRTRGEVIDTRTPLALATDLLESGELTPVIDKTFPLNQASEALSYLIEGEPMGKIIITP